MKFKLIFLFIVCAFAQCFAQQDTLRLKVMTYNLRFGELSTLDQLGEHIKSFKPDFVALEEVDCNTHRAMAPHQNGKNFISELAYRTGMFGFFGKTINFAGGYYGIGMLSKYPVISIEKLLLPNPENKEQRGLLIGKFDVDGDTVIFATTHFDVWSEKTREIQAKFVCNRFKDAKYPVILGGDFNAAPSSKSIAYMKKRWDDVTDSDFTYPAKNPDIKIDYLFTLPTKRWKVIRTQAVQSLLSDHLPIVSYIELVK